MAAARATRSSSSLPGRPSPTGRASIRTLYNLEGVEALPQLFREMGYGTTAMHPNLATNWNRDVVYQTLGFERFLTLDDFEGADTLRGLVSDAATYDACLDIIRESDEPQFVFDVTMQNHSGYKTGKMPGELMTDYGGRGREGVSTQRGVSLIEQCDIAGAILAEELDEPTVWSSSATPGVLHEQLQQPLHGTTTSCYTSASGRQAIWCGRTTAWPARELDADADLHEPGRRDARRRGAPLSDLQKAELAARIPQAVNIIGYEDTGSFSGATRAILRLLRSTR